MPDIANDDDAVTVVPSIDYPKAKVEELEALAAQARADAAAGEADAYRAGRMGAGGTDHDRPDQIEDVHKNLL